MTVTSENRVVSYTGDGSTVTFPVPYYFLSNGDLTVTVNDAVVSAYSVSGAGNPSGGSVTFNTAPASGAEVRIARILDILQPTNYPENTKFPAASHERALDRLTMIDQQQQEELDRAPKFSEGSGLKDKVFPSPSANQIIGWNEAGDALENKNMQDLGAVQVIDEDDMASDSDTKVPTQQSVKAYADTKIPTSSADVTGLALLGAGTTQSARDIIKLGVAVPGTPSGVDDTSAFQAAVDLAPNIEYQAQHSTVLKAPIKYVRVPAGLWTITGPVNSDAKVIWALDDAADIIGADYLTGVLHRTGLHTNAKHTGILENALTLGLRAGKSDLDAVGGVYGILSLDQISRVGPPHSVTLQIDNDTQVVPIELTGTTYTGTTVTYTNTVDLGDVKIGATITSLGSPKHTGVITAVDEATKTVTVGGGWRPFTGVDGSTGTPTNGDVAVIDYFDKIWGQNTNVFLRAGHRTKKFAGYEMGLLNYQADSPVLDPSASQEPTTWGFDTVNLGPYKSSVGFIARGGSTAPFRTGFASYGTEVGYAVYKHDTHVNQIGFLHQSGEGTAFLARMGGRPSFQVTASGTMELGRQDAAQTTFIDLHSDGLTTDFNARINRNAGTNGALQINNAGTGNIDLISNGITRLSVGNAGIGFFGSAPTGKQTVSASRGGNAALAELLTILANYGLITDSSTA